MRTLRKVMGFILFVLVFFTSVGLAGNIGIWLYTRHDAYRDREPVTGRVPDRFPLAVVSKPGNESEPVAMLISSENFRDRKNSGSEYSLLVPREKTKLDTREYTAVGSGWVAQARPVVDPADGRRLVEVIAYRGSPSVWQVAGWYEVRGDSYEARYYHYWFQGKRAVAGMVNGTMAGIALWIVAGVIVEFGAWRSSRKEARADE